MNSKVKRYGMDDFGSGMIAGGRGAFGYTDVIATLEAECERLRSERDAFRDSRNYLIEEISTHLSEIAELREALRSAEIDAARYRWLRDGCDEKYSPATHIAVNCYGMEWDATIDTAMKGDQQ